MKTKQKVLEQLSLFGCSSNQNHFMSEDWGMLEFIETDKATWRDNCRHCPLWIPNHLQSEDDECLQAPCFPEQREDGRQGYFAKHDMPVVQPTGHYHLTLKP